MASGLLLLLDDIATILDDVAVMSKMAAKKTAGVLGDDLALNAQQVSGVRSDRELPVVWSVAKGSFVNKLILVPLALLISVVAPWLIHRHEDFWENPHEFDPSRHEDKGNIQKGTYLPFGMGERICIGQGFAMQESILILSNIIKK